MLILSNLKSGHLVAGIFFWFEQTLIKWRTGSASVLKEIDDRSLLILAIIATRSPRDGNKWSKKSAIIRLIGIQFAKSSIFIVFLSYYMVSIYQFYENDKFISAHNTVFTILILAFILPIIDLALWKPQYEAKLYEELKEREAEIGLRLVKPRLPLVEGLEMGLAPPSTERLGEILEAKKVEADLLGLSMAAYTERRWAEHFGVKNLLELDNTSSEYV